MPEVFQMQLNRIKNQSEYQTFSSAVYDPSLFLQLYRQKYHTVRKKAEKTYQGMDAPSHLDKA